MEKTLSRKKTNIFFVAVVFSIIASFSTMPPNILKVLLYGLSLFITIVVFGGLPQKRYKPLVLLFFFFIVELVWYLFGYGHLGNFNSIVLSYLSMFTCAILASGLYCLNSKQLKLLFVLIILILIESVVATIVLSYLLPSGIIRFAINAEGMEEIGINESIFRTGLVSYPIAHIWCAILVACFICSFECKKKLLKLFSLILSFSIGYALFKNTVTTSFLVGVMCCGIVLVFYLAKGNLRRFYLLSALFAIIGIGSMTFISAELVNIADATDNRQIGGKFMAISENIEGDDSYDNQVGKRQSVYIQSLICFVKNPILGLAEKHDKPHATNPAGDHSTIPDMLAYYGIFSFFLFASWWTEIKKTRSNLTGKLNNSFLICALAIFLMASLKGGFHVTYMVITFLVLKVLFMYIETLKYKRL